MKVKNCMQSDPVTIMRTAMIKEAVALMEKHAIRHLPVMEDGRLVGFITENDLRQFYFPSMVEDIPVDEAMVRNPVTVTVDTSIDQAARLFHEFKIGGLPVMDNHKLVGIITASDLLSAFIEIIGLLKASSRIDVMVDKQVGLDEVSKVIQDHHGEIISVATEKRPSHRRVHYFRLEKCDLQPIVKDLERLGHKVVSVME